MRFDLTPVTVIDDVHETALDAVLVEDSDDAFGDNDCLLFGYAVDELETNEDVEDAIENGCTESWRNFSRDDEGFYHIS